MLIIASVNYRFVVQISTAAVIPSKAEESTHIQYCIAAIRCEDPSTRFRLGRDDKLSSSLYQPRKYRVHLLLPNSRHWA